MKGFILSCLFLFSGICIASNNNLADYNMEVVGTPIQNVVKQLGKPDQLVHYRNGSSLYTYFVEYRSPHYAPESTQSNVIIAPGGRAIGISTPRQEVGSSTLILCSITYAVNAKGIVVETRKKGNGCGE